jgi:hypothetical protein
LRSSQRSVSGFDSFAEGAAGIVLTTGVVTVTLASTGVTARSAGCWAMSIVGIAKPMQAAVTRKSEEMFFMSRFSFD